MTSGKVVSPALSPAREKTDTRGRAAILIVVNTFDPKVRSGQLTNCNQRCNRAERVRCDGGGVWRRRWPLPFTEEFGNPCGDFYYSSVPQYM